MVTARRRGQDELLALPHQRVRSEDRNFQLDFGQIRELRILSTASLLPFDLGMPSGGGFTQMRLLSGAETRGIQYNGPGISWGGQTLGTVDGITYSVQPSASVRTQYMTIVPEPSTAALLMPGLIAMSLRGRRRAQ
jgi:hypothetical protein